MTDPDGVDVVASEPALATFSTLGGVSKDCLAGVEGTDVSSTACAATAAAPDVGVGGGTIARDVASDPPRGRPDLAGMTSWSCRFKGFLDEVGGGFTST